MDFDKRNVRGMSVVQVPPILSGFTAAPRRARIPGAWTVRITQVYA